MHADAEMKKYRVKDKKGGRELERRVIDDVMCMFLKRWIPD